jgi:hypothetical protein
LKALRLMIKNDEVSVLEVETIELVACLLGVYDILVYHKRSSLCVVGDTLADLTDGTEFAKELKEFVRADVVVEVLDEKRAGWLSVGLVSWVRGMRAEAYRFTSGASLPPRLIAWIQVDGVCDGRLRRPEEIALVMRLLSGLDVRLECQVAV